MATNSRNVQIVAVCVIFVVAVLAVTLIVITGASETAIIGFLSTVIVPSVVSLVALSRGEKTADHVAAVADTMDTVKQQTNGALSRILDRLDRLEQERAGTTD